MSRYLVIIVGHNGDYVKPINVLGDINNIQSMLCSESKNNGYYYAIYGINERLDVYIPLYSVFMGIIQKMSDSYIRK